MGTRTEAAETEPRVERFRNRTEAGVLLAEKLAVYANRRDVIVLALPRGGVPVAFEIARALHAPLDLVIVRKLGTPGQEELAMGAIASGGVQVLNDPIVQSLDISPADIEAVAARERQELERRERRYRGSRPPLDVRGRTVILVDDGIATGTTMRVAIAALRSQRPSRIVLAVPVAPLSTCREMKKEVEELICLLAPVELWAISPWYDDFTQTSDAEVSDLLERAERLEGPAAASP